MYVIELFVFTLKLFKIKNTEDYERIDCKD